MDSPGPNSCKFRLFPRAFAILCSEKTLLCSEKTSLCCSKTSLCCSKTSLCCSKTPLCSSKKTVYEKNVYEKDVYEKNVKKYVAVCDFSHRGPFFTRKMPKNILPCVNFPAGAFFFREICQKLFCRV